MKRLVVRLLIGIAAFALLLQAIPYGRDHTKPPVRMEPDWDSAMTRSLAVRSCFDCHSNETLWPWYSNISPVSWLVERDVTEGRSRLNFSEWDRQQLSAEYAAAVVQAGEMPPWFYTMIHADARLSAVEKNALIQGLRASLPQVH